MQGNKPDIPVDRLGIAETYNILCRAIQVQIGLELERLPYLYI